MNRHISFVLDRSGSMQSVKDATISGFNEYVQKLQRDDPDATMQVTLFDTEGIDTPRAAKVKDQALLTNETYIPRASTPLYDAVGEVVSTSQDNPDTAYLVVVLTDGQENSSTQWDRTRLAALIKTKVDTGRWTFAYLGSNQDAWLEAGKWGAHAGSTMTYAPTLIGTRAAYGNAAAATSNWSANAKSNLSSATADFFSGVACQHCGQLIAAGVTHACPKAQTP